MTQEEKQLLLKDLCARLPYGVKFHYFSEFADGEDPEFDNTVAVIDIADWQILDEYHKDYILIGQIMPYLRPMSSMTEEEKEELKQEHLKGMQNKFDDFVTFVIRVYKLCYWLMENRGLSGVLRC